MKNIPKKPVSSESVARLADAGANVSHCFSNKGRMMKPAQMATVDCTAKVERTGLLKELNITKRPLEYGDDSD